MTKAERLDLILKILRESTKMNTNHEEAHEEVQDIFSKIEESFDPRERMIVRPIEVFHKLEIGDSTAYFYLTQKHLIIVGSNGSMEVRARNRVCTGSFLIRNPFFIKNALTCVLQKPGSNGNTIWN